MMKKIGLLLISTLMIFSLVACGEEPVENNEQNLGYEESDTEQILEDNSSNAVESNEEFEEVILASGEGYTISVVDMEYDKAEEEHIICLAVDNQTDSEMYFNIHAVAVNDLKVRKYDWYTDEFPAGKKTVAELKMPESHLDYLGVTEGILKVDICTVMQIDDVSYGYVTYYPEGEEAAGNITTDTQVDGTVIFENDYCKIGYDTYYVSGTELGDTVYLTVQNKTDKLVEMRNSTVFIVNDNVEDTSSSPYYNGVLFPNGTYKIPIGFAALKFEEGMKLEAEFHVVDRETQEELFEDTITIYIE